MSRLSELQQKFRKLLPLLVISLSGVAILPVSNPTNAQTPLTRAVIQDLRNLVQLMPQRRPRRRAQRSDAMTPGDGLSTGRLSLADLRFNDGSLARVGEQAVFQFLPQTRNFTLNSGTVLLLIPPRQGQTNIRTPNATAAIRGSALFVRYDRITDTTVIGALTNSGIEVSNKDASSRQVLSAGQMMVVVKGKFQGLYDFDLRTFYDTSDLVRGFDLNRQNPNTVSDPALDSVRAETSEALAKQSPISGPGTIKDPSFVKLSPTPEESANTTFVPESSDVSDVNSVLTTSEIQSDTNQRNNASSKRDQNTPTQPNLPNVGVAPSPQPNTGTTPPTTKPDTTVTPPSKPDTDATPPSKPETPVTPPPKPETPVTPPPKPETPVTPPPKPETPVTPPSKPETPVTPPPKPETPVTPPPKPETPVTPPPSDAIPDPSNRPST